ncbi:CREB/ATF bZIP transcription factor-like [Amphiura filiformis]|uniref:CREB/ATF bZIP transcription factor-like n=1 Tax=Amphiura filiformis TaxID=82378 RepID=UPI003B2153E0
MTFFLYLMNETGVNISEIDSETKRSQQRATISSATNSRGKKRQHVDDDDHDVQEKNRRNAIAARENRQKKKLYIEGLETENKSLASENARLTKDNKGMKDRVSSLEAEVDYLKSVLYNQSALSGLLKKLGPESQVRLSSSFHTRKQTLQKQLLKPNSGSSGGVCLHVNGKDASLEFCAQCALMAEGHLISLKKTYLK